MQYTSSIIYITLLLSMWLFSLDVIFVYEGFYYHRLFVLLACIVIMPCIANNSRWKIFAVCNIKL